MTGKSWLFIWFNGYPYLSQNMRTEYGFSKGVLIPQLTLNLQMTSDVHGLQLYEIKDKAT